MNLNCMRYLRGSSSSCSSRDWYSVSFLRFCLKFFRLFLSLFLPVYNLCKKVGMINSFLKPYETAPLGNALLLVSSFTGFGGASFFFWRKFAAAVLEPDFPSFLAAACLSLSICLAISSADLVPFPHAQQ